MPDTDDTSIIAAPSPSGVVKQGNEAGNGTQSLPSNIKKMSSFVPSVRACAARKCPELVRFFAFGRYHRICTLTDRIPGNMRVCPKEDELAPGVLK